MFHFLQKKMFKQNRNKGTINVLQGGGGGQRSMVKDHIFTFFFLLDPSLIHKMQSTLCPSKHGSPKFKDTRKIGQKKILKTDLESLDYKEHKNDWYNLQYENWCFWAQSNVHCGCSQWVTLRREKP